MSSVQATNRQICFSSQSATSKALDIQIVQRLNWIVAVLFDKCCTMIWKIVLQESSGVPTQDCITVPRGGQKHSFTQLHRIWMLQPLCKMTKICSHVALLLTMSYKSGERVPLHCHMFITAHFHFLSQYKRLETSIKPTYPSQTHFVMSHNETTTVCFS